eukprot:339438-Rhodomonas_salina.2
MSESVQKSSGEGSDAFDSAGFRPQVHGQDAPLPGRPSAYARAMRFPVLRQRMFVQFTLLGQRTVVSFLSGYAMCGTDTTDASTPHVLFGISRGAHGATRSWLWRCMLDECPHRLAPLSEGIVNEKVSLFLSLSPSLPLFVPSSLSLFLSPAALPRGRALFLSLRLPLSPSVSH